MGSWVQIISATPYGGFIHWMLTPDTTTLQVFGVELGIGAAASEVTIVSPVLVAGYDDRELSSIYLPIWIPANTRVACRCQYGTSIAGPNVNTVIGIIEASGFNRTGMTWGKKVDSLGWNASTTRGVTLDPGTVANTHGSWTQIISSTAEMYNGFFISQDNNIVVRAGNNTLCLDIGVGAAGSEVEILSDFTFSRESVGAVLCPTFTPIFPIQIPKGTRLSARCHATSTESSERKMGIVIHGVR
jgi:hypothetical protein